MTQQRQMRRRNYGADLTLIYFINALRLALASDPYDLRAWWLMATALLGAILPENDPEALQVPLAMTVMYLAFEVIVLWIDAIEQSSPAFTL